MRGKVLATLVSTAVLIAPVVLAERKNGPSISEADVSAQSNCDLEAVPVSFSFDDATEVSVAASSVMITPVAGDAISIDGQLTKADAGVCDTASRKEYVGHVTLLKRGDEGARPASISVAISGAGAALGECPAGFARGGPVKGVFIKIGGEPSGDVVARDGRVARCDGGAVTMDFADVQWIASGSEEPDAVSTAVAIQEGVSESAIVPSVSSMAINEKGVPKK